MQCSRCIQGALDCHKERGWVMQLFLLVVAFVDGRTI